MIGDEIILSSSDFSVRSFLLSWQSLKRTKTGNILMLQKLAKSFEENLRAFGTGFDSAFFLDGTTMSGQQTSSIPCHADVAHSSIGV